MVVGALAFFLLIQPLWDERDALWNRNEGLRAKVIQARADEANLRPFRVQAAALRKRLEAAQERLPLEREVPRLYRQVSDLAIQSGLGLALFQPRAPEEKAILTELPIAVVSESGYHQLGVFFDKIGRLPRIVNLGRLPDVRHRALDGDGAGRADPQHLRIPAGGRSASGGEAGSARTARARSGRRRDAMNARTLAAATAASLVIGRSVAAAVRRPHQLRSRQCAPRPPVAPKEPDAGPTLAAIPYETKGRRDPFAPLCWHRAGRG